MNKQHYLVHIYCGDGKGKTTAATGLAVRAAGSGLNVVITQFLKNGTSSEFEILKKVPNITTVVCNVKGGFSYLTDEKARQIYIKEHEKNLAVALELCKENKCDLLVLDEILGAAGCKLIDCAPLIEFIKDKDRKTEVVLTGRNPSEELIALADYVSEIKKVKHPFDSGIGARVGIEK